MQTDREASTEIARGLTFVIATVIGVVFIVLLQSGVDDASPAKYEVVDKYEQCDVVRYVDKTNRWHYFLHCPYPNQ